MISRCRLPSGIDTTNGRQGGVPPIVALPGSTQRWMVGEPVDHYGDGFIHSMPVEISDDGVQASGTTTLEGQGPETLCGYLKLLANSWRGWSGTRSWTAIEGDMTLDAIHDGSGHVKIAVTLRHPGRTYDIDAWSALIVLTLEAGEQLRALATDAEQKLRPHHIAD